MSGYRNIPARGPSRLREVHSVDPIQDQPQELRSAVVVKANEAVTYELGDEITSYAEAFLNGQSNEIFGESGILAGYFSIGREKLESEYPQEGGQVGSDRHWHLECRTWDLVQRLCMERTKDRIPDHEIHQFSSSRALEANLYMTDASAAETKIVLDWLQDGYTQPEEKFEIRGNRWFYTREDIKARERLGKSANADDSQIVSALDPDAPIRQGKRLQEQDEEFERNLMKAMFHSIRGGNFSEAADIARQSGNHWRAASIQGCIEYSNPLIDHGSATQAAEGNINKPLWKHMCFALARQPGINLFEKAMYGALCGDLLSLLPVCRSWEDRVWANFNAMNQAHVQAYLKSLKRLELNQDFTMDDTSHLTPATILNGLLHNENENTRIEAFSPFRVIQARLITNQVDELLHDMHRQLISVQKGGDPTAATSPHVIRFVTHLILVLRRLGQELPDKASVAIIQAYVELLISVEQGDAIALYAAQLPMEAAVESLARYLVNVEDEEERKEQLRLIIESGIDARATILRTVEIVFEDVMEVLSVEPNDKSIQADLDETERRALRALEWVKLGDDLQDESILLGNILYRQLLAAKRTSAARSLDIRMPDSMLVPHDIALLDNADRSGLDVEQRMRNAIEYLGHSTMVRALVRYDAWKSLVRERPQEINGRRDPVGLRQWKSDLSKMKDQCIIMLSELLDSGWCDPIRLQIPADERKSNLCLLR